MIQVEYKLKLGADEFTIKAEVKSQKEFFETMSFYANLPKVGPGGETDLKLTHRNVNGEYDYYSIVSEEAGKEYRLGQYKKDSGSLFGKGWEPLFQKESDGEGSDEEEAPAKTSSKFAKEKASAPVAKKAAKQEEPEEEAEETTEDAENTEAEVAAAPAKEERAAKTENKGTGNSRINNLMAKYAGKKPAGNNSNLKRE